MTITCFIRSITQDNEKDLAIGWLRGELSEEAIGRAEKLGYKL